MRHIFIASTQEHLWASQSFFKEAVMWKRLRHPNIVPFVGVTTNPFANRLGVDAERDSDGVHREKSGRESNQPGEPFPVIVLDR
jgi:hypothetical protein